MQIFKVAAWSKGEYIPTWECKIEAELIGDALTEGSEQFFIQCPELDRSKYYVSASAYPYL